LPALSLTDHRGTFTKPADWWNWAPAVHVIPETYAGGTLTASTLPRLVVPYLGHIAGAVLAAAVAPLGTWGLALITRNDVRPSAWDAFVRRSVEGRWVVVTLTTGDVVVGQVETVEVSVATEERDLILSRPGTINEAGTYEPTTSFHKLFLPASLIQNIAALANRSDQSRAQPVARGKGD